MAEDFLRNVSLAECSFREWESSPFADDFFKEEKGGKFVFSTDSDKLVLNAEYCGYGNHLHKFYHKKDGKRWVFRRAFSDEQLMDDFTVILEGNPKTLDPWRLIFENGNHKEFVFLLTKDMIDSLKSALEGDYENYFPNYSVSNFQPFKYSMGAGARSARRTPDPGKEDLIPSILKQNSK